LKKKEPHADAALNKKKGVELKGAGRFRGWGGGGKEARIKLDDGYKNKWHFGGILQAEGAI